MCIEKLFEILLSNKPSEKILSNEEEIFMLIPELRSCKGFNQNNEWHVYDVYNHILCVIDYVPSNITLRLSALFHDIGKPLSYAEDENGIGHFYGHWEKSKKIFDDFSYKYSLDKNISKLVSNLIYYHDINIDKLSLDEIKKLYETFSTEEIKMLYKLKRADLLAQNKKFHYILDDYEKQKNLILYKRNNFIK